MPDPLLSDGLQCIKGLLYLHQLYQGGIFKTCSQLQQDLRFTPAWHFKYVQLRHAEAQSRLRDVHLCISKLEHALLSPDHRWLVSTFFSLLMDRPSTQLSKFQACWLVEIPLSR